MAEKFTALMRQLGQLIDSDSYGIDKENKVKTALRGKAQKYWSLVNADRKKLIMVNLNDLVDNGADVEPVLMSDNTRKALEILNKLDYQVHLFCERNFIKYMYLRLECISLDKCKIPCDETLNIAENVFESIKLLSELYPDNEINYSLSRYPLSNYKDETREIVENGMRTGVPITRISLDSGISANKLYRWKKQGVFRNFIREHDEDTL